MSMMDSVRNATDSIFTQFLFAAIVLSFVVWGAGGGGSNASSVIATINGERITDTEFNKTLRQVARSQGRNLSDDEIASLRNRVLSGMIEDTLLLQRAEDMGVEVSDEELARTILEIPAFKDEAGKFSPDLRDRVLQLQGMTRTQFELQLREELVRQRLRELASMSVQVSPEAVKQFYIDQNSELALRWVRISEGSFRDDVQITDEEIETSAQTNADRIQSLYEAQKDRRFTDPRKAELHTILLRTDIGDLSEDAVLAKMEKIRDELKGGADFAQMARRWSEDLSAASGGEMGAVSEPKLEPEVAAAVFAAGEGGLTDILKTEEGYQLVKVGKITEAVVTSLEDATPELARELIVDERAPGLARDFAAQLMERWKAEGEPPAELLEPQKLQIGEADNLSFDETNIPRLGPGEEILAHAKSASKLQVLDTLYPVAGGVVVVQVMEREEADMSKFEAEREGVRQQLLMQERSQFVEEWLNDLVAGAEIERFI